MERLRSEINTRNRWDLRNWFESAASVFVYLVVSGDEIWKHIFLGFSCGHFDFCLFTDSTTCVDRRNLEDELFLWVFFFFFCAMCIEAFFYFLIFSMKFARHYLQFFVIQAAHPQILFTWVNSSFISAIFLRSQNDAVESVRRASRRWRFRLTTKNKKTFLFAFFNFFFNVTWKKKNCHRHHWFLCLYSYLCVLRQTLR